MNNAIEGSTKMMEFVTFRNGQRVVEYRPVVMEQGRGRVDGDGFIRGIAAELGMLSELTGC